MAFPITFIDTPGHAAFTAMRSRGGKAADIVILVVAADDGVMPQTREAIAHAKASGVPIIVAINKIDLPGANIEKAKQMLAQESVLVESWGGDVVSVEVSAKTGENLTGLLDAIQITAELLELKADPTGELEAIIIEAKKERQRGVVVSAIVKNGMLSVRQDVSASGQNAKIRSLMDDKGQMLQKAGPATPVEILGFKDTPNVGDLIMEKDSELAELAIAEDRIEIIGKDTKKVVGLILKADTEGTLEAIKSSLAELVTSAATSDFSLKFVYTGTGDLTASDVLLAHNTNSVIVGFNVKIPNDAQSESETKKVIIRTYRTIYELIDEVKDMLEGVAFDDEARVKGRAKVLKIFKLPSGDLVSGSQITIGEFKEGSRVAIYNKDPEDLTELDIPLYRGKIKKIKVQKDDVAKVKKGMECGIFFQPQFTEIQPGYFIEAM
ncbi:MAG: GTP-binding protein [Patescibacteria group bacterium]